MIKAVIFDWFGVCTVENWGDCVKRELVEKQGMDAEKVKKEYKALLQEFMKNQITTDEFFKKFIGALDAGKNPKNYHYLLNIIPELNMELLNFAAFLKKKYHVYLLSNNIPELFEQYEKQVVFEKYFDKLFLSHELKMSKTEDKIWNVLLAKVEEKPGELVFIDNKEKYLEPAKAHGVHTILFQNNEQIIKELKKLGVKP